MRRLTEAQIEALKSPRGGFTRKALASVGLPGLRLRAGDARSCLGGRFHGKPPSPGSRARSGPMWTRTICCARWLSL